MKIPKLEKLGLSGMKIPRSEKPQFCIGLVFIYFQFEEYFSSKRLERHRFGISGYPERINPDRGFWDFSI